MPKKKKIASLLDPMHKIKRQKIGKMYLSDYIFGDSKPPKKKAKKKAK